MNAERFASPVRPRMLADPAKRQLWWYSTLTPLAPGLAAAILIVGGDPLWSLLPLAYFFVIVPVADILIGEDPFSPSEADFARLANDRFYRRILFVALAFLYVSFFAVAAAVVDLPPFAYIALSIGAGAGAGAGLTIGHEFGHKGRKADGIAAFFANGLAGYAHFRMEHNRGHHAMVATPEDSASARLGESVWRFALREMPGGVVRGWRHESERLTAAGKRVLSFRNEILCGYAFAFLLALLLVKLFGLMVLPFIVIHHLTAWLQLTFANYVEHYGLLRALREDGRREPCAARHSWNSNHIVTNLALFHLQRHSDHHAHPTRPYQALRNFDEAPRLPTGYPGCFLLAAAPPLWRSVMDRRAIDWAMGDLDKLNVCPRKRIRYQSRLTNA